MSLRIAFSSTWRAFAGMFGGTKEIHDAADAAVARSEDARRRAMAVLPDEVPVHGARG